MTDQADGPNVSYQPQGEGPHPTLAGNMFDPGVKADGAMGSSHEGVGGTDAKRVKEEGLEHIKNEAGIGSGASMSSSASRQSHPPASNPSAEDPSGGIPPGGGGVSSARTALSPVSGVVGHENEGKQGGFLDSTLSYLGLKSSQPDTEVRKNAEAPHQPTAGSGVGAGAVGAGAAAAATEKDTAAMPSGKDPMYDTEKAAEKPADSDVTTGSDPAADPAGTEKGEESKNSSDEKPAKQQDHSHDSQRENKSAIPTAGGETLGQKSWGTSKVVPDNPKPRESTQISSEEGQPNKQTENNTNQNTGGAKPPQQHLNESKEQGGEQKHGLAEKMKEKLHIGHHK